MNISLSGRAEQVFSLIELLALVEKQEKGFAARIELANEATIDIMRLKSSTCPFNPEARCNVIEPCSKVGCPVWLDAVSKANEFVGAQHGKD